MVNLTDLGRKLLIYKTVKIVEIHQWKLGLLHYLIQLLIILYILGWVIIYKGGYQGSGDLVGEANIKIKGDAYYKSGDYVMNWDEYDTVFPPKEENSFFLTTNFYITYNQTRSVCTSEDNDTKCTSDEDCTFGRSMGEGISNGTCSSSGFCYLYAWCQTEPTDIQPQILQNIENFTAFVKVSVLFPKYDIIRNNLNGTNPKDLSPNYNLFKVRDILEKSKVTYSDVAQDGALILGTISWDCNFDRDAHECQPNFKFERLDKGTPVSKGFNFRYTKNYYLPTEINDQFNPDTPGRREYRDLYKVYGLRFVFLVTGTGRKFDIVPLLVNLGSGLGLLGVATVVSDFIALRLFPQRKFYSKAKFDEVDEKEGLVNSANPDETTSLLP